MRESLLALAAAVVLCAADGCVFRELIVISEPPGADVYLDGEPVGRTPYSGRFEHYGTRRLVLRKEGYKARVEVVRLEVPWYQYFPLDVFTDLLCPLAIYDTHEFSYRLEPVGGIPEGLKGRAEGAFGGRGR